MSTTEYLRTLSISAYSGRVSLSALVRDRSTACDTGPPINVHPQRDGGGTGDSHPCHPCPEEKKEGTQTSTDRANDRSRISCLLLGDSDTCETVVPGRVETSGVHGSGPGNENRSEDGMPLGVLPVSPLPGSSCPLTEVRYWPSPDTGDKGQGSLCPPSVRQYSFSCGPTGTGSHRSRPK